MGSVWTLSSNSIENIHVGKEILAGETYCWMGDRHENGNWEPHVHIQITFEEPIVANMPGVVNIGTEMRLLKNILILG